VKKHRRSFASPLLCSVRILQQVQTMRRLLALRPFIADTEAVDDLDKTNIMAIFLFFICEFSFSFFNRSDKYSPFVLCS
jgi:hypothetical protein